MTIEESLDNWFIKNKIENLKDVKNNIELLKEAFLAGYNQAIEDRKKIDTILTQ
jgi:hypothetical protein